MNDIKNWCMGFCILMFSISIMRFLIPESKMKKVSDSVLSLIVVLLLFIPFLDTKNDIAEKWDFDISEYFEYSKENPEYNIALERYIINTLSNFDINTKNVDVICELDEEGYIIIKEIYIKVEQVSDKEKILKIIKDECKLDTDRVRIE